MEIGVRVKVIDEETCHNKGCISLKNGDKGTIVDNQNNIEFKNIIHFDGWVEKLYLYLPDRVLKRIHEKKVATA